MRLDTPRPRIDFGDRARFLRKLAGAGMVLLRDRIHFPKRSGAGMGSSVFGHGPHPKMIAPWGKPRKSQLVPNVLGNDSAK